MFALMAGGNRFHSVIKTHKWVALGVSGGLGSTARSVTLGLWLLCVLWNRGTVLSLAFIFPAFSVSRGSALCRVDMLILCHKREGKDERCQQISSIFLSPAILLPPCSAFACVVPHVRMCTSFPKLLCLHNIGLSLLNLNLDLLTYIPGLAIIYYVYRIDIAPWESCVNQATAIENGMFVHVVETTFSHRMNKIKHHAKSD